MKIKITMPRCGDHNVDDVVEVDDTEDGSLPAWAVGKAEIVDDNTPTSEGPADVADSKAPAAPVTEQNPDAGGSEAPKAAAPAPKAAAPKADAPKAEG